MQVPQNPPFPEQMPEQVQLDEYPRGAEEIFEIQAKESSRQYPLLHHNPSDNPAARVKGGYRYHRPADTERSGRAHSIKAGGQAVRFVHDIR